MNTTAAAHDLVGSVPRQWPDSPGVPPDRAGAPLRHRWSIVPRYLGGITAGTWVRLLKENRFAVDLEYAHRVAFLTLTSLVNSLLSRVENGIHGKAVESVRFTKPPVFLLGHWRSGTTFLHTLLSQDRERFAFPNTFEVVNPHTFLCLERLLSPVLGWIVPPKRAMDDVPMTLETPNEDEFAACAVTLKSPYLWNVFPRNEEGYARFLSFRQAPREAVVEWKEALLRFLKKVQLRKGRRLLLKSPSHTAKVRFLLEMFPDALFVNIRRDPYAVYQSCLHYSRTGPWFSYLQRPSPEAAQERILARYVELYDAFFEDRPLIPGANIHELRFEDLERNPEGEVGKLYERFRFKGFDSFRPRLREFLRSVGPYRRNRHVELEPDVRRRVADAWRRNFETWGYAI